MRTRRAAGLFPVIALLGVLGACGGDADDEAGDAADPGPVASAGSEPASPSTSPSASQPAPAAAQAQVLGEPGRFAAGGGEASPLDVEMAGRECVLADALFGSCRASTGTGGPFVVTAESTTEAPSVWNVVVRCGTDPAVPAASAQGEFQPMTTDLGLEPYGEVVGVTLVGDDAEAALVYQPEASECPVVWGLGAVDRSSLFVGGTDALNGEASPIRFTNADGAATCAVADGAGGITVSPCQ
ncbi:hypothetical protein [Nocardioides sp.]|uniref:hypothetical protein n=1 Tax=Nocardioides sp. TaxID=35761 RepID=UPI001A1EC039|nr:hypothetical protein [Nocardioides sp.]MBJ7355884.1 hypothetical protein [Nocardioides sp.]